MCEEVIKVLLEISKVVYIINKWGLSSSTDIKKILDMERRHDISVDVVNEIPIR